MTPGTHKTWTELRRQMAEVVTGQRRPCSRCKGPREDRSQRYCQACRARYMREYRRRQAAKRKAVKRDSVSRETLSAGA